MRRTAMILILGLTACGPGLLPQPQEIGSPAANEPALPPPWRPQFEAVEPYGRACEPAPAMTAAGLPSQWQGLALQSEADAPPLFGKLRTTPGSAPCVLSELTAGGSRGPVSHWLQVAARTLGAPLAGTDARPQAAGFDQAQRRLCSAAGGCAASQGELSIATQAALTPVLWALADAIEAQSHLSDNTSRTESWWREHGGNLVFVGQQRPNPGFAEDRAFMLHDRRHLYDASIRLAQVLEQARWPVGVDDQYSLSSPLGTIKVSGLGDDVHTDDRVLLHIDLGGDDVYLAANEAPVNVLVDLQGEDLYAYPGAEDAMDAGDLPDDGAGRGDVETLMAQGTLSTAPRQGAARGGISMLFDLGQGADHYVTLRGGQGYAQQGVGVLFDEGGNDIYVAEVGAQGAAQMGIGLLIDTGAGADRYLALHAAQGFAGPAGFGALIDDGGDDSYACASTPARYPSPQIPDANASFCQGTSLGFRADTHEQSMPGGVGVLLDRSGEDSYSAAVFAQGSGYWLGTGLLIDSAGADKYHHLWYGGGAAAHFGVGVLSDRGAEGDAYGDFDHPAHMSLGAAHHYGLGMLFEAGGDDIFALPTFGAGAAQCGSVGLFVDDAGDDQYLAAHGAALGVTGLGVCDERGQDTTRGLFIDGGGQDIYPEGIEGAADFGDWGTRFDEDDSELALGLDLDLQVP